MNLKTFAEQKEGSLVPLKPLIHAIQDFYKNIEEQKIPSPLQVYDSMAIRRELFKLRYLSGTFELNCKVDVSEALNYLLTSIHAWSARPDTDEDWENENTTEDFNLE